MKIKEIREFTVEELTKKIMTTTNDLAEIKFKNSLNQLDNPMMIRHLRREIATMNTVLAEKRNNK